MMAARQAGVGLTVVGNGPERANLERLTGDGIELVGWRTDEEIRELVSIDDRDDSSGRRGLRDRAR